MSIKFKITDPELVFSARVDQRGRLEQGNEIEGGHSWQENVINKGTEVRCS